MRLPEICIQRPVLASMMSATLVLFGIIGFTRLPVREFPDVDSPIVNVTTVLRGANPRVIESTVTDVLEEELSTIPGVRTLTSASSEQLRRMSVTKCRGCGTGCRKRSRSRWWRSRTPMRSPSSG
jgi:multidrug efflux pump subunit AcrB